VAAIDVRNDYQPSFRAPHVEHLFPVPPTRALETWAHDRLKAVGSAGRARFTIKNAEVIEVELKKASEGIRGALTTEPAQRYDMALEASLDVLDEHGLPLRTVTVKAARSQTVLEGITPNQREETWYAMTKSMMADFDRQMETEIRNNFGPYLQ
jgi:predicted metal-dependent TIM-barrel fold hydrolase